MRAYFFNNMYLSGIHAGIQAQHCTAEMFVSNSNNRVKKEVLFDWAENHKTTIIKNAGYQENLELIYRFFELEESYYPFAKFHESQTALNNALTSVGIILPKNIYNYEGIGGESVVSRGIPSYEELETFLFGGSAFSYEMRLYFLTKAFPLM